MNTRSTETTEVATIANWRLEVVAVAPENPEAFKGPKVCRSMTANCEPNRGPY